MGETGLTQHSVERGFFADLGHATAPPVGVGRGRDDAVSVKSGEQISVGVEIAAVAEDLLHTGSSELDKRAQQIVCNAVAIGDEGEAQ
ncbi:hypothetical protein EPUS_06862 [Endocarpon pusillum Z07020]|uniref:Uncharacterized protein n=1 Tax=Endocarpon pusillum (strain Z07020 / HMAS-L-300199) TaxID=1263415 RepID=U1I4F4_ENDPU|nr:uncharacterized protein EPUS_06862 [Endocarpon pusillum Z07020]ERF76994.1 hypothetical protein EPUS_06862 [Endocarpon pusillum Z07020]